MTAIPGDPDAGRVEDIHTRDAFVLALRAVRGELTLQQIEASAHMLMTKAAKTPGSLSWTPEKLITTTVSEWMAERVTGSRAHSLPGVNRLRTFLAVCGVPEAEHEAWIDVLKRVSKAGGPVRSAAQPEPIVPAEVAGSTASVFATAVQGLRRRRVRLLIVLATVVSIAAVATIVNLAGGSGGTAGPTGGPSPSEVAGGPSVLPSQLSLLSLPDPLSAPRDIAAAPDGTAWVTEFKGNRIAQISASGELLRELATATDGSALQRPYAITAAAGGAMWFTEAVPAGDEDTPSGNRIGRIDPDGVITVWPIPTAEAGAVGITVAPDGAVWFTEQRADRIGRLDPDGTITEFPLGNPSDGPRRPNKITVGPDGNLWFTEFDARRIGRMSPTGELLDEYDASAGGLGPVDIIAHGGELWFTVIDDKKIGRLDPAAPDGAIRWIDVPTTGDLGPAGLVEGTGGRGVWFAELSDGAITYVSDDPDPVIGPRVLLPDGSRPVGIDIGVDGTVWFTQTAGAGRLGAAGPEPGGEVFDDFSAGLDLNSRWAVSTTDGVDAVASRQVYVSDGRLHLEVTPGNSAAGVNATLEAILPGRAVDSLSFTMTLVSQDGPSDGAAYLIVASDRGREQRVWMGPDGDSRPALGYYVCSSGQCLDGDGADHRQYGLPIGSERRVEVDRTPSGEVRLSVAGAEAAVAPPDGGQITAFRFYLFSDAGRSFHVTVDDVRVTYA